MRNLLPHFPRRGNWIVGSSLKFSSASRYPYSAGLLAEAAFLKCLRSGGVKTSPLPDFYIGAHAEAEGLVLVTRDPVRYRTYFLKVRLVAPA